MANYNRPHQFLDNYGRPEMKLPYRSNDDTPYSLPLGPKNVNVTSPYLIGVIDIRWDNPNVYAEHSGLDILGVNVYRSYDNPEGPYTKINVTPVGALYYRDQTREQLIMDEDPMLGGRFIAGTNSTFDWVIKTYFKPLVVPGTNGKILADNSKHVMVKVKKNSLSPFVEVPAWKVIGETGEIYLISNKVYNAKTNKLELPLLPDIASGGEVRVSYTYIDNLIQTDIARRIYYKVTTVAFDPDDSTTTETSLDQVEAINLYDMERVDYIWAEAIRRNRWILEQGGERVKVFIRKWAGERCTCYDEQYRTSKSDCHVCFPAGTEITMSDFTRKVIEEVKVGDEVLTHKGRVRKVVNIMNRDYEGDLINIKSIHGIEISPTGNHPILILRKEKAKCIRQKQLNCTGCKSKPICTDIGWSNSCTYDPTNFVQWVSAEEIEEGDYLMFPVPVGETNQEEFTTSELKFLGYYAAEGWTAKRDLKKGGMSEEDKRVLFGFNKNETDTCIKELKYATTELGYKSCVSYRPEVHNGVTVTVSSVKLTDLVSNHVGHYSKEKCLSKRLVWQNIKDCLSFIGPYFNGDGYQSLNKFQTFIGSSSASYQMSRQLQVMCIRCNMIPNFIIRTRIVTNPLREGYHKTVSNELKIPKNYMNILVPYTFYKEVPYKKSGKCFFNSGYVFYPVTNIYKKYHKGLVYNLEIEEDNSYIANGISAHNCYGTSYVGGYEGSYDIIIAPPETEKNVMLMDMGLHVNYEWNTWTSAYPLLNDRDIIVRQNNDRFMISRVNPQGQRGAIFQQHFSLSPLDQNDPVYQIPINGGHDNVPADWNAYRTSKPTDASPTIPNKPEIPDQYERKGRTVTFENIMF